MLAGCDTESPNAFVDTSIVSAFPVRALKVSSLAVGLHGLQICKTKIQSIASFELQRVSTVEIRTVRFELDLSTDRSLPTYDQFEPSELNQTKDNFDGFCNIILSSIQKRPQNGRIECRVAAGHYGVPIDNKFISGRNLLQDLTGIISSFPSITNSLIS